MRNLTRSLCLSALGIALSAWTHGGGGGGGSGPADFASSFNSDFATTYVIPYDATTLLINTDDGSAIGPSGTIVSVHFGQAAATLPRFTGDQVAAGSSISFSSGAIETGISFTLAQTFSPTYANGYICAFYTSTGVNYRMVIATTAWLSTTPTFTAQGILEFRWGNVNGLATSQMAGGITLYSDNGTAGSDQSGATIPSGTYTSVASQISFLEKVAIVP